MHQNKLLAVVVIVSGVLISLVIVSNIGLTPGECITVTLPGDSGVKRCKGNSNLNTQQISNFQLIIEEITRLEIQKLEAEKQIILQSEPYDKEKVELIDQSIKNTETRKTKFLENLVYLEPSDYQLLEKYLVKINPPPKPEPPTIDERRIADDIKEGLHDKIKNDVLLIKNRLNSTEIQDPFDPKVLDDDKFLSCNVSSPNKKCSILYEITNETKSEYAFLFYWPGEKIANTKHVTSSDCIIEISTLNSRDTQNIKNKWNDRQWCNSSESILMTDQYNPRNKATINVNSLLMEYFDLDGDRLGIVNAYNLEELIENHMRIDNLPTFNVILLDDQNCLSAGVSKIEGDTTIHMDKSIWQLSDVKDDMFHISEDENNDTNCKNANVGDLDAYETIDVIIEDSSGSTVSKLNGRYAVFEMTQVTDEDLDTKAQVDIFQDWHLLVSSTLENYS